MIMKGKACQGYEFYRLVLRCILLARRKTGKNHAACVLVICCLNRVTNGKIIEDEASHNFWRFLVEDFFLPVIKPPGTYFNNKLLPSCRSSKLSPSFPATSVLLCAPLDPIPGGGVLPRILDRGVREGS